MDNLLTGRRRTTSRTSSATRTFPARPARRDQVRLRRRARSTRCSTSRRPASPIDYLELPIQTLKVGSLGTHKALGLAKAKGARFLLASTSEVYGDPLVNPAAGILLGQREPGRPARRVRRGEALRRGDDDGLPPRPRPATRRSCASSTPTARACGRTTAASSRTSSARRWTASRSRSTATARRRARFCYVDDQVEGIYRLLLSNHMGPVNIGNPDEMTVRELAENVIELTGSSSRDRAPAPAGGRSPGAPAGHHARPRGCSAGSPPCPSARGSRERSGTSAPSTADRVMGEPDGGRDPAYLRRP